MAEAAPHDQFLGLNEEDEKLVKEIGAKVAVACVVQPLTVTKTLVQLGHEPFPLSTGKTLICVGRNAYFLPNMLSYAHQLAQTNPAGVSVLFTGLDSACMTIIVGRYVSRAVTKYIDKYYPEIGGKNEFDGKDERELTDHESFRRMLRSAIRDSVVRVFAVFAARPFTVSCVRQIAQIIGGETKYSNCVNALRVIGHEEGPPGLFSGVIPQLMAELVMVWGVHSLTCVGERLLTRSGLDKNEDKTAGEKDFAEARRLTHFFVPHIVSSFSYQYTVVSTVMATIGSGLAVAFLPYNPSFGSWHDCFNYLQPHGLKRGARFFLREQTGAISVGLDKQLYASTKHFV